MEMRAKYQLVWWGFFDMGWGFHRIDPAVTDLGLIYRWCLSLGPLEIRRWT